MREWRCVLLCGALAAGAVPRGAMAEPAPSAATRKARMLVDEGIKAQDRGDYQLAIQKYQEAYELRPHPTLIFNLAQVHRLAGDSALARSLYQRYLTLAPTGDLAPDARTFIAELDARTHAELTAVTPPLEVLPPPAPAAVSAPADRRPGLDPRIASIVAAAAGTVSLAVGIGYWVHSGSLNDQFERRYDPADPAATQHLRDAGYRANTIAWVTGITGGALIAGGATLYWWNARRGRPSDSVAVAPLLSDRVAGLAVSGTIW